MNVWERIAMYILSCVFILSGVSKAINVPAFAYEVRMYSDAYLMDGIGYWSQPIAVLVCAMEILVGLLALRTRYMKICSVAMLVMLSFFVWLTGINYFCPSIMGSIESCGCFGEVIHFTPFGAFLKSILMWIFSLLLCILKGSHSEHWNVRMLLRDSLFYSSFMFGIVLPLYSLLEINHMGSIAYSLSYALLVLILLILYIVLIRRGVLHSIFICSIFATLLLVSCSPYSYEVQRTLEQAGENKRELQTVLEYFSTNERDSLKLRAAEFLISNMYWHTNAQSGQLDNYYSELETIYSLRPDSVSISPLEDSLLKRINRPIGQIERKFDSQVVTSSFLINHIERMFEIRDSSMCQDLPFDIFCEYVLPYRVWQEKTNTIWVDLYRETGLRLINRNKNFVKWDSLHLSDMIVRSIKHNYHVSSVDVRETTEGYSSSLIMKMKRGTCLDYANRGCLYFRSLGIPTAIDILPQWGNQHGSHEWTSFLMDSLCHYSSDMSDFSMSGNLSESQGHHIEVQRSKNKTIPKIYRITFSANPNSLALTHGKEPIPQFFMSPHIYDVSSLYIKDCVDVELDVPSGIKNRYLYLSVFDNQEWQPVAWSECINNKVKFLDVSPGIVYMLTSFDGTMMQSCGYPFLLRTKDEYQHFVPDKNNIEQLTLTRKFKVTERVVKSSALLGGGRIELSNDSAFVNPEIAFSFPDTVSVNFQYVPINVPRRYRYVRFLGGLNKHGGEIAEMEVYDNEGKELSGRPISNESVHWQQPIDLAFDKNPLTYFRSVGSGSGYCGLDFGSPQMVSEVDILPRNDGNYIQEGDLYELFFWDNGGWQSLGKKYGPHCQYLEYDNVPSKSLLLLRDLTKGKEKRIFTWENDLQKWY